MQVQGLAEEMQAVWKMALEIARETCEQAQQKPSKKYLCRGNKRTLMDLIAQGKQARTEYENSKLGRGQAAARRDLHETLQRLRQERRALTKSTIGSMKPIGNCKKRKERFQELYNTKQKLAN